MFKLRRMLAMVAGLTAILVGGAALAQVGTFAPDDATTVAEVADDTSELIIDIPEDDGNDGEGTDDKSDTVDDEKTDTVDDEHSDTVDDHKSDTVDDEKTGDTVDDEKTDTVDDDDEARLGIEFVEPDSGVRVKVGEIRVSGFVSLPATVTVNDVRAESTFEGYWHAAVPLKPGKNILVARAVTEDGRVAENELVVYWDKESDHRLGIEITSPSPGTETARESIKVQGFVNYAARVTVGDRRAEVNDDGRWWVVIPLQPGKNRIVARAVDSDGHVATDDLSIWRTGERELGIEITSPANGARIDDVELKIRGAISKPATVTVNGRKATVTDDLTWYVYVGVEPGWNRYVAKAVDEQGNRATDVVEIFLVTGESVEFTANQVYGSCAEEIPYDVFYGTATPGTVIKVISEYGSGNTVADETGNYELRVNFPESPFNKEFLVKVKASTGESKTFTFVRLEAELEA